MGTLFFIYRNRLNVMLQSYAYKNVDMVSNIVCTTLWNNYQLIITKVKRLKNQII